MNEFYDMLKEAMTASEKCEPAASANSLEASVSKFGRRVLVVRWMALIAVTFGTAVMVTGVVLLARASDDASFKSVLVYVGLVLFGFSVVAFIKMWFALALNHIAIMKELKVIQLRMLDAGMDAKGSEEWID